MKIIILTIASIFLVNIAFAQTSGTIKGKLIDSVGKQSMKDASITVLALEDSTVEAFGLAKEDGSFEVLNVPLGNFIVQFSFQGYSSISKTITLSKEKPEVILGTIYMPLYAKTLDEVVVTQTPPITIKKDTVEYNAGSFKTKPNAVVEDLLKKLPGVIVDKDGNINAQGEQVQRIFVDGKRFFGNDPKLATKNLPPDIVDKIQVYDAQSDQSAFSGFDDGERTKTINIITKKDRRKGLFGRAIAGAGDQRRYDASVNMNLFNGNQKLTLLTNANNVNKQGFTAQDGGGSGRSRGGITDTKSAGLNYSDLWGKSTDFSGSYFYNNLSTNRDARSFTERFLKNDSSSFINQTTTSQRNSQNHRFNFNIEHRFDSMNSLVIRPDFSFQESDNINRTISNATIGSLFGKDDVPQYRFDQNTSSQGSGYNGDINATFRHRFKARGHTFSIGVTAGGSSNTNDGTNYSDNRFYYPKDSARLVNQINRSDSKSQNISSNFSYTIPVIKNHVIELNYNYSKRSSNSDRRTYSYDSLTSGYTRFVDSLSNYFENENSSSRASIGYRIQKEKFTFGIANGIQFTNLKSDNTSKVTFFDRNFTNIYPTANFVYNFTRKKNLRINYNGRSNQPSITQLQPVPDNSNQNNIITGNPNLGQEFYHNIFMRFSSVDQITFRNISFTLNGGLVNDRVVSSIVQNINGTQTTTFENLDGSYNLNGNFNYGFQLKKPKSSLNFITTGAYNRDVSLIALPGDKLPTINYTTNTRLGQAINFTMNLDEKLDLNFNTSFNYNFARYSVSPDRNRDYYTQSFSFEPTYTFKSGWVLGSDFDYTYNSGLSAGYNANLPLWNASLAKQIFAKKQGEIKFSVFDLLNQNISVSRDVTNNYVRDMQNNVLQRYFLVTFTYNLRKFPGGERQNGGNPNRQFRNNDGNGGFGGGNRGGGNGGGNFRRGSGGNN